MIRVCIVPNAQPNAESVVHEIPELDRVPGTFREMVEVVSPFIPEGWHVVGRPDPKPDPKLLTTAIDVIERWHRTCRRYDAGNASGADMGLARQDVDRALKRAADAGHDITDLKRENDL